ncbi:TonB-dependent receptor [Duganella sp. FT27W]|uniref:TonB-dependent siderophore receptor n=1 Tax=Duganella sp. FT27W TaxID=2654636 RepID=UPI00128E2597|nr:TonB-dependent receptor [Duganella sp. FT27W]MPQ57892.1 TonB-dependent siderophore receptor [Duganella sp. FT27W]
MKVRQQPHHPATLALVPLIALAGLSQVATAQAQSAPVAVATSNQPDGIPAGALGPALSRFAARAGVALSFDGALVASKTSAGLTGAASVDDGFAQLLRGTGLQAERLAGGAYTLKVATVARGGGAAPSAAPEAPPRGEVPVPVMATVEVTAQRTNSTLIRPTRQSTEIGREELDELRQASDSLATVLAKVVPGMADSSRTITDYGQTLRGRTALVLVDGIPLNTNRDSSRNMASINLASIDKVEVLRGSSALYGAGASGGIIAITTRPAGGAPFAETSASVRSSLSRPGRDGLGAEVTHYLSGTGGDIDYAVNAGLQHIGASYDGKGRRIAPEPSQGDLFDSDNYTFGAKIGLRIDRNQRLQLAASRYVADQDSDYGSDPAVARLPAGTAVALPRTGLQLARQNQLRNSLASLSYQHRDLLGSAVSTQLYYRDYYTRFTPFDARAVATRGNNVDQVMQNSRVAGGRATIDTPLATGLKLLWGVDVNRERSDMPDDVFDPVAYDTSGGSVFQRTGTLMYMPPLTTRSVGAFGQLQYKLNPQWSFEGGVRREQARAKFDDFVPLSQLRAASPRPVRGGALSYAAWMTNAGAVFKPAPAHEVYASLSQGFQLPDMGIQLRNATPAFNLASSDLKPVKTNHYELGWRGATGDLAATAAVFHTTSKLGDVQSFNNGLILTRTAEKIRGVEASVDYVPAATPWGGGATVTAMRGRETPQGAIGDQAMSGYRIPPVKVTGYVQYKPAARWSSRLQVTHFGARDYRLNGQTGFGRREVSSYTTLDLVTRYQFDRRHTVSLGIENLLDRYYLPAYSQLMRNSNNTSRLPAPGAVLNLSYQHRW